MQFVGSYVILTLFFLGFEPKAVETVLNLISFGTSNICQNETEIINDVKTILASLQIDISLPELPKNPCVLQNIKLERNMDRAETGYDNQDSDIQTLSHICDICDKGFTLQIGLEKHRKKHFDYHDSFNQQRSDSGLSMETRHSFSSVEIEDDIAPSTTIIPESFPTDNQMFPSIRDINEQANAHFQMSGREESVIDIEEFNGKSELSNDTNEPTDLNLLN